MIVGRKRTAGEGKAVVKKRKEMKEEVDEEEELMTPQGGEVEDQGFKEKVFGEEDFYGVSLPS